MGTSSLPKLQEAFTFVQHKSSKREIMLHQTTIETTVRVETQSSKQSTSKPRSTGLAPNRYWCDYCGKARLTHEKCWKLLENLNDSMKKTSGNNSKSNEKPNLRANITEEVP